VILLAPLTIGVFQLGRYYEALCLRRTLGLRLARNSFLSRSPFWLIVWPRTNGDSSTSL